MHVIDGWSTKKKEIPNNGLGVIEGYPGEIEFKTKKQLLDIMYKAEKEEEQKTQYDRTATPSSIAGLGEAASTARLRGALANLEYNENKLRAMEAAQQTPERVLPENLGALERWIQKPTKETEKERTLPEPLGGMERWIQPADTERYQMQQKMQRIQKRLPTLDYLSWGDRGMPRPETYTAENLTDYLPRIEQLAGYPGRPTKDMQNEAKEVVGTAHPAGTLGNAGWLGNFQPYRQALAAGDMDTASRWAELFYKLDGAGHPKQYAAVKGFMDGSGYTSVTKAITQLPLLENARQEFEAFQTGADFAANKEPFLRNSGYLAGTVGKLWLLKELGGLGLSAIGMSGPLMPIVQNALSFGASEAIRGLGDYAAGETSPEDYWKSVERASFAGGVVTAASEIAMAGEERLYDAFLQWKQQRDAAVSLAENPFKEIGTKSLIGMSKEEISRSLQERGIDRRFADRTAEMIALEGEVQKTLVPKVAAKQPETEKAKSRQELTEKEEEEAFLKGFNYDIIQEIQEGYSDKLKEELKSGRAWEESKEEFIRRAASEGYTTYDRQDAYYGVRRVKHATGWGTGQEIEASFRAQDELRKLGIQADVIEADILYNCNGVTRKKSIPQAATLGHRYVVINYQADMSPKEISGHEAFHLWENGAGREEYAEILRDNLVYSSERFIRFQSEIAQRYMHGEIDIMDDSEFDALAEEIFAYISGQIHDGGYDMQLRPMFRNYDAVKAAWYELIRRNR